MLKSVVFGLCVPVVVTLLTAASGCTVTTNNTDTPDGSIVTPTGDSGKSGGDSATPSTAVLGFTPSNLGDLLETLDLSKVGDIDVAGNTGRGPNLECAGQGGCVTATLTQSDGSTASVYIAKSWKIEPTADMPLHETVPIILVALDTITVLGRISSTASSFSAYGGGFAGVAGALQGAGPGGGGQAHDMTGAPVGGGGASHCGAGGKGGNAATFGLGGTVYGAPTAVPLQGGSAGGGGTSGAGGGAFQLVAGTSITISAGAALTAGGGGGEASTTAEAAGGGSGGGSGGAVLLEAPIVTVEGTIAVNGGGGGGGAYQGTVTNGSDATADATPASGGETGTAGAGGNGSALVAKGTDGATGDNTNYGAGGGGGGAGWIRINTKAGAATISGTLSPAATTQCATQGTLAP